MSFPLLRPPTATEVGVPDDGLLMNARVQVKDDIWTFEEVHLESERER